MANKGVKKIKWVDGLAYTKLSKLDQFLIIPPDQYVWFNVKDWLLGTTEADKKKDITWLRQENDRKTIIREMTLPACNNYGFKITKKFCGAYSYYIEASLSGQRDFKNISGLYVRGFCENKIVSSQWRMSAKGGDMRSHQFSYGDKIYLHLETEGLNGCELIVDIYNLCKLRKNTRIHTYTGVRVIDGEVNIEINNTSLWMGKVENIQDEEKFYITVKTPDGQLVKDPNNGTDHAKFLRIKKHLSSSNVAPPKNITSTTVFKPDVNAERYESCKFETIKITEIESKDGKATPKTVTVFDQGKKNINIKTFEEKICSFIHFVFDKAEILNEEKKKLNNILSFLLEHPGSTIMLSGYACVIGTQKYNKELSQRRSDVIKKFFTDGGLDGRRILSIGYGEINPTDDKKGRDNIKYKNEENYQECRRVDITFTIIGHDADSLVYETIAPSVSTKKTLTIDVTGFETAKCIKNHNHEKKVTIIDVGQKIDQGDKPSIYSNTSINYNVYSDLSKFNAFPIQYIWPIATTPNQFWIDLHSCRYYSKEKNPPIIIKAYPDIKWELSFFLNLTNDLSVKWQNQPANKIKELQKKAGKMGAERRWKQKECSFGFSLKSDWNKNSNGIYMRNKELKAEYEGKFKKLYNIFAALGASSDAITNSTKGQIRNIGMKGMPVIFEVKPPNLNLKAVWNLERAKTKGNIIEKIGTKVDISFNSDPLIGLEITIDLLCTAVGLVAGAVSGGTAAPGAVKLYGIIKGKLNSGVELGNDDFGVKASADVFIDLVISSVIKTSIGFSFNTSSDKSDSQGKLELTNKLKVELKAGVWIKAEISLVIVKIEGYFEMSGKGYASVTFGHKIAYDTKGLIYRPQLGFDGLNAEYVIKGKVGLSSKKKILAGTKPKSNDEGIISEGKFNEIIPKFDIIKSIEELFDISAEIPLIKND